MDASDEAAGAALGDVFISATVSHVITRACTTCGGPRTQGEPCAQCGNLAPPIVHDLGVVAAAYRDPAARDLWSRVGRVAAELKIKQANAQGALLRRANPSNFPADADDQI